MSNRDEKAKEIFMKYEGNHFYMSRNGAYEDYKKYQVSKEQEIIWILEYQNELIKRIDNNNSAKLVRSFCTTIKTFFEISNLGLLITKLQDIIPKLDTYTSLLIIDQVLKTLDYAENNNPNVSNNPEIKNAKSYSVKVLRELLEKPITVNQGYIKKYGNSENVFSEDNVLARVKGLLDKTSI